MTEVSRHLDAPLTILRGDSWSKSDHYDDTETAASANANSPVDKAVQQGECSDQHLLRCMLGTPELTRSCSPLSTGSRSLSDLSFDSARPDLPTTLLSVSPVSLDAAERPSLCQQRKERGTAGSLPFNVPPPLDIDSSSFPLQDTYLLFMEPGPVLPPLYDTLAPGGCPRFHVFDNSKPETLPAYQPSAYKIGLCARKLEWYSPYEASPIRSWKNFIVELNSTQLNFYLIPSQFEPILLNSRYSSPPDHNKNVDFPQDLRSLFTCDNDVSFHALCELYNILPTSDPQTSSRSLSMLLLAKLTAPVSKRLVRSYSLQHAKVGLASDYTKRSNVLRLRLENEQLLILFGSAKEMIQWNLGISVGRDLALDITDRELPRYRTVPRRRRNNIDRTTPFYNDVITRRQRAQSDPNTVMSLRGRLFKLKSKLNSSLSSNLHSSSSLTSLSSSGGYSRMEDLQDTAAMNNNFILGNNMATSSSSSSPISSSAVRTRPTRLYTTGTVGGLTIDPSRAVLSNTAATSRTTRTTALTSATNDDDLDEDIRDMSDLHNLDDDDDLEAYMDILAQCDDNNGGSATPRSSYSSSEDHKWHPLKQIDSEKRILRDALKCIRPLTFDDSWLNKTLVKPTTYSPLTLAYLRESYFVSVALDNAAVPQRSSSSASLFSIVDKLKRTLFGKEALINLPDSALTRIPHHNLREYSVGPHSLTPKYI